MSVYKKYHLTFKTPEGDFITSGLQVTIVDPATADGVGATIYSDEGTTAKTNSITDTVFAAAGGVVEFYSTASTLEVLVRNTTTLISAYVYGITARNNFIVFDQKHTASTLGRYTDVVTISSVDYLVPELANDCSGTNATMTLATTGAASTGGADLVTICLGTVTTEIELSDPATAVPGALTVIVNRGGAVIETLQANTTNNKINDNDMDVEIADGGYLVLMETVNEKFAIVDSLDCSFVAQNT